MSRRNDSGVKELRLRGIGGSSRLNPEEVTGLDPRGMARGVS